MSHTVLLAQPGDARILAALCTEHARFERARCEGDGEDGSWLRRLREALHGATPRLNAWIAFVEGSAVGYASAVEEFSTWGAASFLHMDCLFIRPGNRNGGIGAALLGAVIQCARDRGLRQVQWQTPAWNADAARFYLRHGAIACEKTRFAMRIA